MRGVEEFQAAKLHEGNVTAGQLDLERAAVMRRPKQHGLVFQDRAALPVFQDTLHDVAGLIHLVPHADQFRALGRTAFRPKVLGETLGGEVDHAVCGGKDWHG